MPAPAVLVARLAERAADEPDTLAFADGGAGALSFAAWERKSNALARGLRQRGVDPGHRVVLRFDSLHWSDHVIAAAGVLKVGAVAVPVAAVRSALDLGAIVGHCGAMAIVVAPGGAIGVVPPGVWAATVDDLVEAQPDTPPPAAAAPDAVEIGYPAGHLRPPRPTRHTDEEIVAGLAAPASAVGGPVRQGVLLHAFGVGSGPARLARWAPLGPNGPTVVTLAAFDPERFAAVTEALGVDRWLLAPATALLLADSGALGRHDVSSVRRIDLAGPPPPTAVMSRLIAALPADRLVVEAPPAPAAPANGSRTSGVSDPDRDPDPAADVIEAVAAVFGRVLGVEHAGADADFFALGGDEMAALKALRLLEDTCGLSLRPAELVAASTVSTLAAHIASRRAQPATGSGQVVPEPTTGVEQVAPIALSQEGMLWQEQFVPGSQNLPPLVRRFRGPLDVGVLEAALQEIVRRHEPLRSRFELRSGRVVQVVPHYAPEPLPVRDLETLDPAAQQEELTDVLAHARRPFDLARGPMFEPTLFRLGADDHVVVFRVHHSVYDDWSVSVFRRELSALYAAFAAGEPSPLPELALGFTDFARSQHRRLAGPAGAAQLRWWKTHLGGAPFSLQLPIDDPDLVEGSPQQSAQPVTVQVPPNLTAGVRALARRQRATPFMTMLAGFQALVHRYTSQSDLLMASVVANRNRPELEPMIGGFTKKILLRQDMAGDPTFAEVLDRTRVSVLGALPHQDLSFETILQETVGADAAAHGLVPYVGVMFQGVTPQVDEVVLPGVTTTGYDTSATTTRAHFAAGDGDQAPDDAEPWGGGLYLGTFLILSLVEGPDAMSLVARGAFHGPAVERLLANLIALLDEVVADPDRPVSRLRVIADDQWRQLLQMGNLAVGDAGDLPGGCALDLFHDQVARAPSRAAVRWAGGELSYAELRERADALAARLTAAGVGRGSLVGICVEASEHAVVAVLAVWTAGATYVGLDPADDADHLAFVVADAALGLVVTRQGLDTHLPATVRALDLDADAGPPGDRPASGVGPDDVAMVFYGAAASAVEHGLVIEHRSVVNLAAGLGRAVYGPPFSGLRVGLWARLTDDAFARQLTAVLGGHTLHVADIGGRAQDRAAALVALVGAGDVDVIDGGPEDFGALAGAGLQAALAARLPAAPTSVLVVGSRQGPDRRLVRVLQALQGARASVLYGTPECGFAAIAHRVLGVGDGTKPDGGQRATVGRPLSHVRTYVLGPQGAPVPVQVTGELYVGGYGLARGGGGTPDVASPLVTRSVEGVGEMRLFRTGQRARYLPDGRIELLGATADIVSLRGFSVDRARLEAAMVRCPGVDEARVVVEPGGDGGAERLVAHVVAEAGAGPTPAELRVWLWSQHPGCAWPAEVLGETRGGWSVSAGTIVGPPEEAFLATLWAEVAGVGLVRPAENYWQWFPFLDVVTRAGEAGLAIGSHQVTRNRTVATLAVDLAATLQSPLA